MKIGATGIVSAAYLALVTVGGLYIYLRMPEAAGYRASKLLPVNHLLVPGDVVDQYPERIVNLFQRREGAAQLKGYTTSALKPKQAFRADSITTQPLLVPDANSIVFSAELDAKRVNSGEINAGVTVGVCDPIQGSSTVAHVMAVVCIPESNRCTAILEAPAAGSEDLVALLERTDPAKLSLVTASGGK